MWTHSVVPNRAQMTIWRMRISRWLPKATDTLRLCNFYCFSTTTVARKRLNVTVYAHCLSCFTVTRTFFPFLLFGVVCVVLLSLFFVVIYLALSSVLCPFSFASSKPLVPFYLRYSFARWMTSYGTIKTCRPYSNDSARMQAPVILSLREMLCSETQHKPHPAYTYSFSILSDDRSNASSKTVPPYSAI
jgi:hypothetical protein